MHPTRHDRIGRAQNREAERNDVKEGSRRAPNHIELYQGGKTKVIALTASADEKFVADAGVLEVLLELGDLLEHLSAHGQEERATA